MALNENQEAMFRSRAEKSHRDGDRYFAMSKEAQAKGNSVDAEKFMKQSQHAYQSEKENLAKAEEHKGKSWK